MRRVIKEKTIAVIEQYQVKGKVLEIGGLSEDHSAKTIFNKPDFEYYNLDLELSRMENTFVGDITSCPQIEDESFDVVFAADVFEHVNRPWLAAEEITRILKKGGFAFIFTLWSWRYHPLPIDYWRFSPECLKFLFSGLETVEAEFDMSNRRADIRGFWENKLDHVPVDSLGGWRENWAVYYIGKKI